LEVSGERIFLLSRFLCFEILLPRPLQLPPPTLPLFSRAPLEVYGRRILLLSRIFRFGHLLLRPFPLSPIQAFLDRQFLLGFPLRSIHVNLIRRIITGLPLPWGVLVIMVPLPVLGGGSPPALGGTYPPSPIWFLPPVWDFLLLSLHLPLRRTRGGHSTSLAIFPPTSHLMSMVALLHLGDIPMGLHLWPLHPSLRLYHCVLCPVGISLTPQRQMSPCPFGLQLLLAALPFRSGLLLQRPLLQRLFQYTPFRSGLLLQQPLLQWLFQLPHWLVFFFLYFSHPHTHPLSYQDLQTS